MSWGETSRASDADNEGGNESNPVVQRKTSRCHDRRSIKISDGHVPDSLFGYDKVRNFPRRVWCPSNNITLKREKSSFRLWK